MRYLIWILPFFFCAPLMAANFTFGVMSGMEFPFAHTDRMDPGFRIDAFYRLDPYEVRFHYSELNSDFYSVGLGRKFFFSNDEIRPFFESAVSACIVDTHPEGLAYGMNPEISLGVELGINENFSTSLVARYGGYWYFGNTGSGDMEANHGLNILAGLNLWF